jgi:hypothetical protein
MENVNTFDDWQELFKQAGVSKFEMEKNSLEFNGMKGMVADEGFTNSMAVMLNYIKNSKIRNRMKKLNKFILSNPEFFGYGIYICDKN